MIYLECAHAQTRPNKLMYNKLFFLLTLYANVLLHVRYRSTNDILLKMWKMLLYFIYIFS